MKKFFIKTFGCQMNKHDSEKMAGLLIENSYQPVTSINTADIVILNTCYVRKHAEERLYGVANSLKNLKKENPHLLVAVGGCLGQKLGTDIFDKAPTVDLVFGTHNLVNLVDLIKQTQANSSSVCELLDKPAKLTTSLPSLRESKFKAWVTITSGCNNFCSYCVVPYVRGGEISRPLEEILADVENLAKEGVIEITLLGQNVNSYGADLYGESRFSEVLIEVNKIDGIRRVRFTTSHPKDLSDKLIEAVTNSNKVCKHFHLPFQAGSDRILELMNRAYDRESYLTLVEKIYHKIPDASVTTDVMVGFPTETEEDFKQTLKVVEKARFDQAFTFIYSPRPGTTAEQLKDDVSPETKLERFNHLLSLQNQITLEKNLALVGKRVEVLVEKKAKRGDFLSARTNTNKVVNFKGSKDLIGRFVEVKIEEAHKWSLMGEIV